jgi:AcrR family transcriptional regulator
MSEATRADGRRNHDLVLEAARGAFAEQGTEVSLREVARRAGVGIGTLYRHFPTREALVEAALRQGFDNLRARAEELLTAPSPEQALISWMGALATGSTTYHGLPASLMAALRDERSQLYASCEAMRAAATRLLDRAQRAGQVRSDVSAVELFALVAGLAWAGQQTPGPDELTDRLLSLAMTGLRAS